MVWDDWNFGSLFPVKLDLIINVVLASAEVMECFQRFAVDSLGDLADTD